MIIKVCGITNQEDAKASVDAGANALGFNFYRASPRYVSPKKASEIMADGPHLRVGVFVNASEEEIRLTALAARLDVIQLHGNIAAVSGLVNWRAMQVTDSVEHDDRIEAYLLDTFTPGFGGSGKTFDWSLAKNFPYRAIIAGGLDGGNVAEAIRIADPWGVDACSRLESQPGRKDWKKVSAFVDAARMAVTI